MNRHIAFLLVITLSFGFNEACKECTLIIQNLLTPGSNLKVICESNRKDRVNGEVKFKSNPVQINFKEAYLERTTWHCMLRQGAYSQYFRAYRGSAPVPRCGELRVYIAKPDGIYLSKNRGPEKLDYRWNKN
ncbi:S-protein homolog 30 [Capsella rubella]|uniref:S-protein homolog 30 n=1 Tax=Capsella rubella TaxID=81985 RepID=UPI000CD5A448|nr:S-protein homolog 30 [Capsella rubella]